LAEPSHMTMFCCRQLLVHTNICTAW